MLQARDPINSRKDRLFRPARNPRTSSRDAATATGMPSNRAAVRCGNGRPAGSNVRRDVVRSSFGGAAAGPLAASSTSARPGSGPAPADKAGHEGYPIVDIYCHIFPERFLQEMNRVAPNLGNIAARLRGVKKLYDLDLRFREMDQFGDYRQIISLPNPPIEDFAKGPVGLELARIGNEAMAELCRQHPQRFAGFVAAVCLTDVEGSVAEARRAIGQLDARGVQIFTNIAGKPLDDPSFAPIFAIMAESDLPVWLHPARTSAMTDYAAESKSRFEMWWCFGWPYETSVAMSRLVFSGLFDRHPKLKIVTHHCGGMIPYYDGRIGLGMEVLGSRTSDEDYSKVLSTLKRPHLDYFRDFYADTAMFGGQYGIGCGLEFFGIDKLVFATDTPLGPIAPTVVAIDQLELDPDERRKVFCGNAERLLNMTFA